MILQNCFHKTLPLVLLISFACTEESKFNAGTKAQALQAEDTVPTSEAPPLLPPPSVEAPVAEHAPVADIPCEKANVLKDGFPAEISSCYESGRVWNFDSKECVVMKAAKFSCDWTHVISELGKIGLESPDINKASTKDTSILIGCGQSEDNSRIVVQWINVPEGNGCKNVQPGLTITGCFTNYGTRVPPPVPTSKEERDSRTYACMNEL